MAKLEAPDSISGLIAARGVDASQRLASVDAFQKVADVLPPIPTPPRSVKIAAGALSKLIGGVRGIAFDLCAQHLLTCYVVSNLVGRPALDNQMVVRARTRPEAPAAMLGAPHVLTTVRRTSVLPRRRLRWGSPKVGQR